MHANTVFLLGLGLLLVVGRGFGYVVPEDGIEGKRSDIEDDSIGRSSDLNQLELEEKDEALREEDILDPGRYKSAAAAAAAASRRNWYKSAAAAGAASSRSAAAAGAAASRSAAAAGAAASRSAAAAGAAASRSAAAAAAAAARAAAAAAAAASRNKKSAAAAAAAASRKRAAAAAAAAAAAGGGHWDWPSSLSLGIATAHGIRNEDGMIGSNELARLAALKYLDDEGIMMDDEMGMKSNFGEDDGLMNVVRDDPNLELYYRLLEGPLRQYEEEMQSMDETVIQEPDSFSKRVLENVRESTPQVYFRLLENLIENDDPVPTTRSAAAAAAAASRRRQAAAAAAAAASNWRSAARSAAAAAAAASRGSPIIPISPSYRLAANRSAAAAAAAAGYRSAAASGAASHWRNME